MRLFNLYIFSIYIFVIFNFSSLLYPSFSTVGRLLTFYISTFFYFSEGEIKEKMGLLEGLRCLGGLGTIIV